MGLDRHDSELRIVSGHSLLDLDLDLDLDLNLDLGFRH